MGATLRAARQELREVHAQMAELRKVEKSLTQVITALNSSKAPPPSRARRTKVNKRMIDVINVMRKNPSGEYDAKRLSEENNWPRTSMTATIIELIKTKKVSRVGETSTGQPIISYKPTKVHPE